MTEEPDEQRDEHDEPGLQAPPYRSTIEPRTTGRLRSLDLRELLEKKRDEAKRKAEREGDVVNGNAHPAQRRQDRCERIRHLRRSGRERDDEARYDDQRDACCIRERIEASLRFERDRIADPDEDEDRESREKRLRVILERDA